MSRKIFTASVAVLFLLGIPYIPQLAREIDIQALPPAAKTQVDFSRDVEPLFKETCYSCHGPKQQMGGLRLDEKVAAMAGGYAGPVIKPGNSAESKLIHLVAGLKKDLIMPMVGERLTPEQVGLLRAWIDQGAKWPEEVASVPEEGPGAGAPAKKVPEARSKHWAFLPPQRPPLPKLRNNVRRQAWVRNPIDALVLAKLEAEGIEPSQEADRVTLIRRISFDLVGLPPTPKEIAQFLADKRADAYERLVDRLLASPHYGEKWARHWLDLAHYADSDGYETDRVRPHAWQWRDWVIQALNRNMPFDEFTVEQIAGDLLPNATIRQKIATGFLRNTLTNREGGIDLEEYRVEQVVDRTSTLGTVWLAMTVGCARCHDHKYDPLTQKEFYQLFAFFDRASEQNIEAPLSWELGAYLQGRPEYDNKRKVLLEEYKVLELQPDWERKTLAAGANPGVDPSYDIAWDLLGTEFAGGQQILKLDPGLRTPKQRDRLTDQFVGTVGETFGRKKYEELKFKELKGKLDTLKEQYPELSEAQILVENPDPPKTHILIRGDHRNPGIEVQPATPAVLNPPTQDASPSRLTLGRWLVSKDNPLTARVWVNRAWQEFFGRGLVGTSGDFGTRGDRPTHPELLDWLAAEFMASGWNMKRMHRLIVESATYRQSSNVRDDLRERDAYNKLLARQVRLSLPAELVRDSTLVASGLLNRAIGGKSVRPPQPPGVIELGFGGGPEKWIESTGADRYRRGLYTMFLRTTPYPQLLNFDAPDALLSCTRRERSTTPLQALNLLNDPVFVEAAQVMAIRILREERGSWNDRLNYAFRLSLGREPRPQEKARLVGYYQQQKDILEEKRELVDSLFPAIELEGIDPAEAAAWLGVCRLLLNLDEFITRS